jgi:hypothetical protein
VLNNTALYIEKNLLSHEFVAVQTKDIFFSFVDGVNRNASSCYRVRSHVHRVIPNGLLILEV